MSTDPNEPIDFSKLEMFDNLPGAEPAASDAGVPASDAAPVVEESEEEAEEKPGLLEKITSASPFTVMLALSLVAIIIAVIFLGLEINQYGWDIKAKAFTSG